MTSWRSFNQNSFIDTCLTWYGGWLRTDLWFRANTSVWGPCHSYFDCSYFNFTITLSLNLGLDFTNIPRRHSPTLSSRHYWSKGQFNDLWNNDLSINDFVVPAMISQDFSDCSIQTSKSYFKSFYAKFRWRLQLTNARTTRMIVYYIRQIRPIESEHSLSRALIGLFIYR